MAARPTGLPSRRRFRLARHPARCGKTVTCQDHRAAQRRGINPAESEDAIKDRVPLVGRRPGRGTALPELPPKDGACRGSKTFQREVFRDSRSRWRSTAVAANVGRTKDRALPLQEPAPDRFFVLLSRPGPESCVLGLAPHEQPSKKAGNKPSFATHTTEGTSFREDGASWSFPATRRADTAAPLRRDLLDGGRAFPAGTDSACRASFTTPRPRDPRINRRITSTPRLNGPPFPSYLPTPLPPPLFTGCRSETATIAQGPVARGDVPGRSGPLLPEQFTEVYRATRGFR